MQNFTRKFLNILFVSSLITSLVNAQDTTVVYQYTGDYQVFVVPENISSIDLEVFGASSSNYLLYFGNSQNGGSPGLGGQLECSISVTPGDSLHVYVGGQGLVSCATGTAWNFGNGGCHQNAGGWNGGGDILMSTDASEYVGNPNGPGWAGGGASDIRLNGNSLSDRIVVSGGGGGQSKNSDGGHGGGQVGQSGLYNPSPDNNQTQATGGSQTSGGQPACLHSGYDCGTSGSAGQGGNGLSWGYSDYPGGGGGGYFGGGGGSRSYMAGGGGSSYASNDYCSEVVHVQGVRFGHGSVSMTYTTNPIFGCTDPSYFEYSEEATFNDSSCVTLIINGCMDSNSCNYDQSANQSVDCDYITCLDECGVLNGDNSSCVDDCGIPNGDNSSCVDECGVPNGDNSSCVDECGVPNGDNLSCTDECGVLYGDNSSCLDICGVPNGSGYYYVYIDTDIDGLGEGEVIESCINLVLENNYVSEGGDIEITGCTDSQAVNYLSSANTDDETCIILGCMDADAVNYDANANTDNGMCQPYTLADVEAIEVAAYSDGHADGVIYGSPVLIDAVIDLPEGWSMFGYTCIASMSVIDGFSEIANNIVIVKDEWGLAYLPSYGFSAFDNLEYGEGYQIQMIEEVNSFHFCQTHTLKVYGCIYETALNYNPDANTDDGSCVVVVEGCMDTIAFNHNSNANVDDGSCTPVIEGCMDETAFNYNSDANTDDGCIAVVNGCMDESAFNYNPEANTNQVSQSNLSDPCYPYIPGCMDTAADNYDESANTDNGSCLTVVTNACIDGQNGEACVELAIENGVDVNSIQNYEVFICLYYGVCQLAFDNYIGELSVLLGVPYTCEDATACNYMENMTCSYPEMNCYDCDNILINSEDLGDWDPCNSLVLEQGGILVNSTETISWNFLDPNTGSDSSQEANDIPEFVVAVYDLENNLDNNAFTWFEAVAAVEGLVIDGYDDWVLPSPAQLAIINQNLVFDNGNIANISPGNSYWSTEYSEARANYSVFYDQPYYSATSPKSDGYGLVRAVRNF